MAKELNYIMQTNTTLRNKLFKNGKDHELVDDWKSLSENQQKLYARLMIDLIKLIENPILLDDKSKK